MLKTLQCAQDCWAIGTSRPIKLQEKISGMPISPFSKSNTTFLSHSKQVATSSASVSPGLHLGSCYLSSPPLTGAWRSAIKNAKHFEMLGSSLKEDLERGQLWIRKKIPACPLQLISCQTGTGDLITSIKFACITHHITGGWSDPTTLFTLCPTYCLCWGKENCN